VVSTSIFPCQLPLTLKTYIIYLSYALLNISNLLFVLSLVALDIWGLDWYLLHQFSQNLGKLRS